MRDYVICAKLILPEIIKEFLILEAPNHVAAVLYFSIRFIRLLIWPAHF